MLDLTVAGVALVPVILGLVQVAREAGLPSRFAPLLSLAIGLGGGFAAEAPTAPYNWQQAAVVGVALGLSASGLYSGVAKLASPATAPEPAPASTDTPGTPAGV